MIFFYLLLSICLSVRRQSLKPITLCTIGKLFKIIHKMYHFLCHVHQPYFHPSIQLISTRERKLTSWHRLCCGWLDTNIRILHMGKRQSRMGVSPWTGILTSSLLRKRRMKETDKVRLCLMVC